MGCLKLTYGEYRGKIIKMPSDKKKKKKVPKAIVNILYAIIPIYLGWLGAQIFSLGKDVRENNIRINTIDDVNKKIDSLEGKIDSIDNGLNGKDGIYSRLSSVETLVNISAINASSDTQEYIDISVVDNNISTSTSSISADTCIGTDSDGKAYIAKDLIGQTILLTFDQGNKEVYFLGQYNNKYHWDGYCVTNTYDAVGLLDGVCESNFDDGTRLDYESFYRSDNQEEWIYTDRDCKKDVNEGISTKYKLDYSKQKNFTITNARVSDIIYIEDMKNCENKQILSYYDGITSDGVYNDNTGNAYLVRYNNEGFVNVFYQGCFKNGYFDDTNALEIVLDESVGINKYFVYQGKFSNGKRLSDEGIKYVTQEEINTILKDNECPDDLKWYSEK